nr:unnamed protein product [Digitaria exilis]
MAPADWWTGGANPSPCDDKIMGSTGDADGVAVQGSGQAQTPSWHALVIAIPQLGSGAYSTSSACHCRSAVEAIIAVKCHHAAGWASGAKKARRGLRARSAPALPPNRSSTRTGPSAGCDWRARTQRWGPARAARQQAGLRESHTHHTRRTHAVLYCCAVPARGPRHDPDLSALETWVNGTTSVGDDGRAFCPRSGPILPGEAGGRCLPVGVRATSPEAHDDELSPLLTPLLSSRVAQQRCPRRHRRRSPLSCSLPEETNAN